MNDGTRSMGAAVGVLLVALVVGLAGIGGLALKARGDADRALRAAQAELDRALAEKKELADNLNERRRELEGLEHALESGLAELGDGAEVGVALAGSKVEVTPAPKTPSPVLPPPSFWEGSDAERRRALITDTQRRIAQLEKVIGEVNHFEERKAEVQAKLAALEQLRRTRAGAHAGSAP